MSFLCTLITGAVLIIGGHILIAMREQYEENEIRRREQDGQKRK
jgi:hypothetical protein